MRRILITGIRGFVGSRLANRAKAEGWLVRGALRSLDHTDGVVVGDIGASTEWGAALDNIDTVFHLAARVHVMSERELNQKEAYWSVNVYGTEQLARQAANAGVRRLVFLSSVKVNGEITINRPFSETYSPAPAGMYAQSKWEAEQVLQRVAEETGLEVVIIRSPLIYGPGVKANFLAMMKCLHRGIPMPLGDIQNRRSLVALDNLVDFLFACSEHPAAANETFLVADGESISTTQLLKKLGQALNKPARLVSVPHQILMRVAAILGKKEMAQRLCGSLQVDISKAQEVLGWVPPVGIDQALSETAQDYLNQVSS